METRFSVGQKVRSLVSAQGITAGAEYTVVNTEVTYRGIFGGFTRYALRLTPQGPIHWVGNGHLVLKAVA